MVVNRIVSLESSMSLVGLGFLCGYLATVMGFWSPGDGKALWAFTVALPPTLCPSFKVLSLQFALVSLLVNATIAYLAFLGVHLLIRKEPSQRADPEDESGGLVVIFARNGAMLGITLVVVVLALRRPLTYLEAIVLLFVLYRLTDRPTMKSWWS